MGVRRIINFCLHRFLEATLIILLITFLPNLPPYSNYSESFRITPNIPLEGKLELKEKLADVELWHKGDFMGPEALADYNGELYASIHEGDIIKLTGNHITPIVKFGKPCKGIYEERICGRPLGLEFDKSGVLYAADAYYGLFKVDVKTGQKTQLISPNDEIEGKKPKLFNNLAIASNGDIYWSDSSTEFYLEDGLFDLMADPSGRLIHYDAKTKKNRVLLNKLAFANGVVLSDDEEFVLVVESNRNRVNRYYLKGPKQGKKEIFIDGLPGMPDNITPDGQGGFLVALIISVDTDHPLPIQMITPFPLIRKFFSRVMGIAQLTFKTIDKFYPNEYAQRAIHFIGHFTSFGSVFIPKRTTIIRLSRNGEVLDSLHNLNNKLQSISEAYIFKDMLYFGSPFNNYLARIPLSKIGWNSLVQDKKKYDIPQETPKVKITTKPPTTTTQPPKQQTPPPKQTTSPPPPKQQTTTPTSKQQTTSPPPKPQQTQPPPSKQQQTQTPPPKQQQTQPPPPKQQTQPPPPKQQQTQPPPPKQQQTTPPPPKQQQTTPPPPKQQQTTPPPPKQQQTTPPPPKQQQTTPPPPKQQQTTPPRAQTPSPKQAKPTQQQTTPPAAQPAKEQAKSVPVKDTTKKEL